MISITWIYFSFLSVQSPDPQLNNILLKKENQSILSFNAIIPKYHLYLSVNLSLE